MKQHTEKILREEDKVEAPIRVVTDQTQTKRSEGYNDYGASDKNFRGRTFYSG
jgi:hypothetical protein